MEEFSLPGSFTPDPATLFSMLAYIPNENRVLVGSTNIKSLFSLDVSDTSADSAITQDLVSEPHSLTVLNDFKVLVTYVDNDLPR
jgi:hypothetical protein